MIRVVVYIILFFVAVYLSLFITGRDRRVYRVVPMGGGVSINGEKKTIDQLAHEYQPKMFISSNTPSPTLLWTWYEVILRDGEIDIVYYQNWEDEINPNAIIHNLYRLFRASYYGYPTYDIEFFQVSVSTETGNVTQLLFETSPGNDYYVTISEHIIARYKLQNGDVFNRTLTSRDTGVVLGESVETVRFQQKHVLGLAQTWNHLSALVSSDRDDLIYLESSLKYLSERDYASLKFVRKSQGDHKTYENKVSSIVASFGLFFLVFLPSALIKFFGSLKNRKGW